MKARYVKMFSTNIVDSQCRQSLLSVPQGVSSAWGGRFLCSLAINPPPHILPPPWLPKPLHYSSSHYPHRQPLTDECVSRQQSILPYYILLLWSPPTTTSSNADERNMPLSATDYKITYKNIVILYIESLGAGKAVWFTVKQDRRRSFWNVKYFRALEGREERGGDRGRRPQKWEKWGKRR